MDSASLSRRSFMATVSAGTAACMLGSLGAVAQAQPAPSPPSPASRRALKVGYVMASEQFPNTNLLEWAGRAEAAGFDAAWSSDHFQPWQPNEGHTSQAWITLAAAGQRTSRLLLGTGVTCPTYRYRPAIVAEAFASLGQLAPGRVFLGLGTGEALNEVTGSGMNFPPYRERAARLVEAIEIIRRLWTGQMVDYHGKYYQVLKARLYDVPAVPVPIYVAGNGPKSARLAGVHGDGWIATEKLILDPQVRGAFEEGARAAGKDPSRMPIVLESWMVNSTRERARPGAEKWRFLPRAWKSYVTDPDPADIERRANHDVTIDDVLADWTISETPADHAQALHRMQQAGATHVFVHSPMEDQAGFIDFYQRVLPLLSMD